MKQEYCAHCASTISDGSYCKNCRKSINSKYNKSLTATLRKLWEQMKADCIWKSIGEFKAELGWRVLEIYSVKGHRLHARKKNERKPFSAINVVFCTAKELSPLQIKFTQLDIGVMKLSEIAKYLDISYGKAKHLRKTITKGTNNE